MKQLFVIIALVLLNITSSAACTVCKTQQPKILENISHGSGPDSNLDYVIVSVSVLLVLVTLVGSVWHLIKPGEQSTTHIKRSILNTEV